MLKDSTKPTTLQNSNVVNLANNPPKKPGEFSVEDHNDMIFTIDNVIKDIRKFDPDDLELNNAVKNLLEAAGRINNYYKKINCPKENGNKEKIENN